jgi:hypothetical protein
VRRASSPGTFYFSVLDNGVVSKEFQTIVDFQVISAGVFSIIMVQHRLLD